MPFGTPRTEEARKLRHGLLYGEGMEPPVERLGIGPKGDNAGETIWDVLPALPLEFGIATLPLPRKIMRDIAKS
jgi:hypothetical protein